MFDIIGDVHGQADDLVTLLSRMGYRPIDGAYHHPGRTVIFLGDFIDRGERIKETLAIVRSMVEAGSAPADRNSSNSRTRRNKSPQPSDAKPVFVGRYGLVGSRPKRLARNVACLDWGTEDGRFVRGYRWDGEQEIDDGRFIQA